MRIQTLAGTRTLSGEPPRSTAYYYADLERLKKKNGSHEPAQETANPDELSEYVETSEVVNDGAVREVPPFRDRGRQWSLPEYNTPENSRKIEETYSTAGTFPMPEPKEKEPLLAELEVVGRLPLTQLESASGVRRSRSWYLCCPNVADEEISRESSWRYSSLRPVTAPPVPGHNGITMMVATQGSGREDVVTLRAERDALSRALASERARAAALARAHDARLAELHGVIAELVRRRAHDKSAAAIPEEDVSDECESTTQPAGELDNDEDLTRTEQNGSSSALSPELPPPRESKAELSLEPGGEPSDTDTSVLDRLEPDEPQELHEPDELPQLQADDRSESADSCERERPSSPHYAVGTERARSPRLAARVPLRTHAHTWTEAALDVCAHADLSEALLAARNDECVWAARCGRLRAERRVLQCALARAADTAHRLYCACAVQESTSVSLCGALAAADRALEVYDVLLALAETSSTTHRHHERESTELVACQLLARLDEEQTSARIGSPLLSPGPWLTGRGAWLATDGAWDQTREARLRAHAARLKADTVALRATQPEPKLFSYHDVDESELGVSGGCSAHDMEAAVALHDALLQSAPSETEL